MWTNIEVSVYTRIFCFDRNPQFILKHCLEITKKIFVISRYSLGIIETMQRLNIVHEVLQAR